MVASAPVYAPPVSVNVTSTPWCRGAEGGGHEVCLLDRQRFFIIHGSPGSLWNNATAISDPVHAVNVLGAGIGRSFAVSGLLSTLPPTATGRVNETVGRTSFCRAPLIPLIPPR